MKSKPGELSVCQQKIKNVLTTELQSTEFIVESTKVSWSNTRTCLRKLESMGLAIREKTSGYVRKGKSYDCDGPRVCWKLKETCDQKL